MAELGTGNVLPELAKAEHAVIGANERGAKKTVLLDKDGNQALIGGAYSIKVTEVGSVKYLAKASVGASEASAVWQAMKIDLTTGVRITYADGDQNFDNVASDLTALTYS